MRISDWSSDVCSSDLNVKLVAGAVAVDRHMGKRCLGIGLQGLDRSPEAVGTREREDRDGCGRVPNISGRICHAWSGVRCVAVASSPRAKRPHRSEEHTSELQSLMRISYAVFCLKKKKKKHK